jgi:CDP-4-dehydro-6-deoxyglucose reductase
MIAYDTGFSAIKSLVEHAISLELGQSIHLYWLVPDANKPYLHNQCRAWVDALDNFCYTWLPVEDSNKLFQQVADDYVSLHEHDIYLNMPRVHADEVCQLLLDIGARDDRIKTNFMEHF